ncbi:hypothetical protein G7175_001273 [Listeria monocytogenes]|nr:hypothetical protein [Listeria monocytogenes]
MSFQNEELDMSSPPLTSQVDHYQKIIRLANIGILLIIVSIILANIVISVVHSVSKSDLQLQHTYFQLF